MQPSGMSLLDFPSKSLFSCCSSLTATIRLNPERSRVLSMPARYIGLQKLSRAVICRMCASPPDIFDCSSSRFSSGTKYTENFWSFKLTINIAESSHMAELNDEFSVAKLIWLMAGGGCNSNPMMRPTGYQCTPAFLHFCVPEFASHAEGCF